MSFCHQCGETDIPAVEMYSSTLCQICAVETMKIDKEHIFAFKKKKKEEENGSPPEDSS